MTDFKPIRRALQDAVERGMDDVPSQARDGLIRLVKELAAHDRKTLEEVLQMLGSSAAATETSDAVARIVETLRAALMDEKRYFDAVSQLAAQRHVTKAMLIQVYKGLFRRSGGIRASAPRSEVVDLLIDERNVLNRYGVLDSLTRPADVAAE